MPGPRGRFLLQASLAGLGLATLLGVLASFGWAGTVGGLELSGPAHAWLAVLGFAMPGLAYLHWAVAGPLLPSPLPEGRLLPGLWLGSGALAGVAALLGPGYMPAAVNAVALLVALAAGILQAAQVLRGLPRTSVVDVARDPLTKGDDASLKHVKLAHMAFLPLGLLLLAAASVASLTGIGIWRGAALAGSHLLLGGYGLLSVYGLSHIAIPRMSGVPAIAAGAIKGELHTSLLGLLLLTAGFVSGISGLVVAGGAFLFLGAFVFMGVLGANIMKNKSPTQRVTPEFAYVPWTFAAVFWLIAGVLLGLFLTAAQAIAVSEASGAQRWFALHLGSLRFVHVHALLLGGFAILLMGFATRLVPASRGAGPAPFSRTKLPFYALNAGLVLLLGGHLADHGGTFLAGSLLAALGLAGWFISIRLHGKGRP